MNTKPGWQTTEFWVTKLSLAAMILGTVAGYIPGTWSVVGGAIAAGLYAISRGLAKSNATDDQLRQQAINALGASALDRMRPGSS